MAKENDTTEGSQPDPQPEPQPEEPNQEIIAPPLEIVTYSEPSIGTEVVVEIDGFEIKTGLD
jgi:hypothetical protein